MVQYFLEQFKGNKSFKLVVVLFVLLLVWWITMFVRGLTGGTENDLFTLIYPFLALLGGISGYVFSKKWGGFKSTLGSTMGYFSLGLIAQFLGQLLYNYYIFILGIDEPYPSIGDVSYFLSVIFYIIAAFQITKVAGVKFLMQSISSKLQIFLIPFVILLLSYLLLLKGYEFDFSNLSIIFLDFAFPFTQAIYVSFALVALYFSRNILGGMMKKPIILLLLALIFQFVADFSYSYQFSVNAEAMYTGDYLDLLYCISYFLMAISLFSIGNMFYKVQES